MASCKKTLYCPYSSESTAQAIVRPDEYELCLMSQTGCNAPCIQPFGSSEPGSILVVGDNPGFTEDRTGESFSGKPGQLIKQALTEAGVDLAKVLFTYTTRCKPADGTKVPAKVATLCANTHLKKLIADCKPAMIVAVGSATVKALFGGKESGITQLSGLEFKHKLPDIPPTVVSVHPAFVMRNLKAYYQDLADAMATVKEVFDRQTNGGVTPQALQRTAFDIYMPKHRIELADTLYRLYKIAEMPSGTYVSYDIETNGLSPWAAGDTSRIPLVLTVSLSISDHEAVVIPLDHPQAPQWDSQERDVLLNALRMVLQAPQLIKVGHNLKFDNEWLTVVLGVEPKSPATINGMPGFFDTMLGHALVNPLRPHGLDALSVRHCNGKYGEYWHEVHDIAVAAATAKRKVDKRKKSADEKVGDTENRLDYSLVPLSTLTTYNAYDTMATYSLINPIMQQLIDTDTFATLRDVVMPTSAVVQEMEISGLCFDPMVATQLAGECVYNVIKLEAELAAIPEVQNITAALKLESTDPKKQQFKPSSVPHKVRLLYQELKLPIVRTTDSGNPSADKKAMKELQDNIYVSEHAKHVMKLISDWSEYSKVHSTYLKALPKYRGNDGRIHTSYSLLCRTGRNSCRRPNLQNQPSGIRKIYVSRFDDGYIMSADMSQLEARVAACYSHDPALVDIFLRGLDYHIINAALMLNKDPGRGKKGDSGEVTDDDRQRAKSAVSFGIMYGRSAMALAKDLGIPLEEAERMRTAYLNKVHVFVKWCNDVIAFARKNGYVTTLFGRRRPVPDIWAEDNGLRAEAERVAVNTPIQGTAADLTMMALVRFNGELKKRGLRAVPVVTVHDSIVVDVPADEVAEVGELLLRCMEDTSMYPWAVIPFTADIKVDRSWDASSKKLTKTHDSQLDYEVDEEEEDDVGDES